MRKVLIGIAFMQFCMLVVGLIRGKALSLIFGPDGFGLIGAYDQLIVVLTQIGALGMPFAAMKVMSEAHTRNAMEFRSTFSRFFALMVVLALVATGIAMTTTFVWPSVFGASLSFRPDLLRLAILGITPLMITVFIAHTLAANQKPTEAALFGLLSATFLTTAAITGSLVAGLRGLYALSAVTGFVVVCGALVFLHLKLRLPLWPQGLSGTGPRKQDRVFLKTAFSVFFVLVGYAACLLAARLIVLSELGETQAGFLQAAIAVALSVGSVVAAIINIQLAPALNQDIHIAKKFSIARESLGHVALLLCLGTLPFALFPGTTLRILYSAAFVDAGLILVAVLIWQILYQILTIFQQILISIGAALITAFYLSLGYAVSVAAMAILTSRIGLIAAPLGLIAGTSLSLALHLAHLFVVHQFTVNRTLTIRISIATAVAAVSFLTFRTNSEATFPGTMLRMGILGLAYIATALSVSYAERRKLFQTISRQFFR